MPLIENRDYANHLSIYLLKPAYKTAKDIFKDANALTTEELEAGNLYYGNSYVFPPSWVEKFFGSSFNNEDRSREEKLKIFSASARAVLLVNTKQRTFAITFGYGRALLNPGIWEERFGLKVAANVVDPENLRSIDKKNMSVTPKLAKEQIFKAGTMADFGIDIEQDLIEGMTGASRFPEFGKTVTGKDALTVSVPINRTSIKPFLDLCHERFKSHDYKKSFDWLDYIAEVKSPQVIQELNSRLVDNIQRELLSTIWMAIPEIILWEDVKEFKIPRNDLSLGSDIHLLDYLKSFTQPSEISLKILQEDVIECINAQSDSVIYSWKAFNCLYAEIKKANKMFILSNGNWYEVEKNFADKIDQDFQALKNRSPLIALPQAHINEHENDYNIRVGKGMRCCMDRKMIQHGGGRGQVEFCDLLTKDKKIIHVKRYGASSVFSHLFAQGLVSSELLLDDIEFRKKVRAKLLPTYRNVVPIAPPHSQDYKIVFAVISDNIGELAIPFFSKINLRNTRRRLESFGYKIAFQKIQAI